MSMPGDTPYYILAHRRQDELLDYVLMNPRGYSDEVVHVAPAAARDEEQAFGRIQNMLPPWQIGVKFRYVSKAGDLPTKGS